MNSTTTSSNLDDSYEGMDDSFLGWTTDIMLGVFLVGTGLWQYHRTSEKHDMFNIAVCYVSLGIAFFFGAAGHSIYANRAHNDGCGDIRFYACWVVAYPCMCFSVLNQSLFTYTRTFTFSPFFYCTGKICNGLYTISALCTVIGAMWCVEEITHLPKNQDKCYSQQETCDAFIGQAEAIMFLLWGVMIFIICFDTAACLGKTLEEIRSLTFKEYMFDIDAITRYMDMDEQLGDPDFRYNMRTRLSLKAAVVSFCLGTIYIVLLLNTVGEFGKARYDQYHGQLIFHIFIFIVYYILAFHVYIPSRMPIIPALISNGDLESVSMLQKEHVRELYEITQRMCEPYQLGQKRSGGAISGGNVDMSILSE